MGYAQAERQALCALLDDLGADRPTLCTGWSTRDLAAHLVIRERHPAAAAGILGGPMAGHNRKVQAAVSRQPFRQLVEQIRTGPPRMSAFALPGADERTNLVEYFVHHEDVRRGQPGWEPRDIDPGLSDALWRRLPRAKFILRKAPVGIEFARDNGTPGAGPGESAGMPVRITARARTPMVTVVGSPAELTLWALGRTGAARVRLDGSDDAVRALAGASWRV